MVSIVLKNPTVSELNNIMKEYSKLYDNVVLKYDYKNRKAIIGLSGRKIRIKKAKYERCVKKVKKSSPRYNPYGVCRASLLRKKRR